MRLRVLAARGCYRARPANASSATEGGISGLARDLTRCGCANINVLVLSGCADLFFGGAQAFRVVGS